MKLRKKYFIMYDFSLLLHFCSLQLTAFVSLLDQIMKVNCDFKKNLNRKEVHFLVWRSLPSFLGPIICDMCPGIIAGKG